MLQSISTPINCNQQQCSKHSSAKSSPVNAHYIISVTFVDSMHGTDITIIFLFLLESLLKP